MAEPIVTVFKVEGLPQTKQAFKEVEESANRTAGAVKTVGDNAEKSTSVFSRVRSTFSGVSAAFAGAAAIASLFARNNEEAKRSLEVLSLTLSAFGTIVSSVSGLMRGLVALVGIKIVALGALAAAVVFVVRNWDQALAIGRRLWQSFAAFMARLWGALVETGKGLGEILAGAFTLNPARIQAGVAQFKVGLGQLKSIAVDVGSQIVGIVGDLWAKAMDLFGTKAKATRRDALSPLLNDLERWKTVQMANASTIESTTAKLATQRSILEEYAARLAMIPSRVRLSADEHRRLQDTIKGVRTDIEVLNIQLREQVDSYSKLVRQQFELQRAMERNLDVNDAALAQIRARLAAERLEAEIAEQIAAARRRLILDTQEYEDALRDAARAQEDWNRQNEFDARQQAAVEGRIGRQIEAQRRHLDLMDEGIEKRRQELAGLESLINAINAEIQALEREIQAKTEAGLPTEALIASQQRLRDIMSDLQHQSALTARAIRDQMLAPIRQFVETTEQAFADLFTNVLSGAQSFGDTIVGFFRSIVNAIISSLARLAASWIVRMLFSGLGGGAGGGLGIVGPILAGAHGGIMPGGFRAFQSGGVITRPTLGLVGEGGQNEAVVPLPNGRSIPVDMRGGQPGGGPTELVIHQRVVVVMDPRQIPAPNPDEINTTVATNINSGGVIYNVIRKMIR